MTDNEMLTRSDWEEIREQYDVPEMVHEAVDDRFDDENERVFFFEAEREIIIVNPRSETLRELSSVAHLESSTEEGYKFGVSQMDVWNTGMELEEIRETFEQYIGERPNFNEWLKRTYERQHVYKITKQGHAFVFEASTPERLEYAKQIDAVAENLVTDLSDTQARIDFGSNARAEIKKALIKKGYPVTDDYDMDDVDVSLGIELDCTLRDYQQELLDEAWERQACVLANPSGSGKTVTAIGMIAKADAPTLILVPQRSLIPQWREELKDKTTLEDEQIGEYHGDTKNIEDVTIATYHIAASKTPLFRQEWGLIIFDEVHHIPASMYRKTADLQSKRRLGLSASPVREDSKEREIFALIGPEIGGDWGYFFNEGHVLRPDVSIHFVPWDPVWKERYEAAEGITKQIIASKNPRKHDRLRELLVQHETDKTIIFADWIDQAETLSEKFGIPQITGETDHDERQEVIESFRAGEIQRLIISRIGDEGLDVPDADTTIVMSGQGGSRRQATQRAGRVMRPEGDANVHFVATKGSNEEDFVKRQMELMKEKGIDITVNDVAPS